MTPDKEMLEPQIAIMINPNLIKRFFRKDCIVLPPGSIEQLETIRKLMIFIYQFEMKKQCCSASRDDFSGVLFIDDFMNISREAEMVVWSFFFERSPRRQSQQIF